MLEPELKTVLPAMRSVPIHIPPSPEVSILTSQLLPAGAPEYRAQPLSFQKGELKAGL